jgi:hypothetical protein
MHVVARVLAASRGCPGDDVHDHDEVFAHPDLGDP